MGIVAYCPNQHRVKVKDELAGRKGICPTCGVRFRIPRTSQPEPAAGLAPVPAAVAPAASAAPSPPDRPVAEIVSLDPDLAATLPRALPLATPE
jgi:hypothetical protein